MDVDKPMEVNTSMDAQRYMDGAKERKYVDTISDLSQKSDIKSSPISHHCIQKHIIYLLVANLASANA